MSAAFFISSLCQIAQAQLSPSVMFNYAGNDVSIEEFERQFLKNAEVGKTSITASDIDDYLNRYINFKLKFQDARDAGMDTQQNYLLEMAGYREQLAKNYLYDREVTDKLIQEAYDRLQFEIRAAHILVAVDQNAKPADTMAAYLKIKSMYDAISKNPAQFESMAKTGSDDPGTKENGGDLGYFTAMQLVYPFENAAYSTPMGNVSGIFRTQFGYHILKVLDKRANRGDIRVRHILLRVGITKEGTEENVSQKIKDIYSKIAGGEATFAAMATQWSEDYNTQPNGGLMDWFSSSQFVGDLDRQMWADQAFALKNNGDYTQPFRTGYGWHLLQRVDVAPLGSFDQLKHGLRMQVQNDQRAQKSVNALIEKVKAENNYTFSSSAMTELAKALDTNFKNGVFVAASVVNKSVQKAPKPVRGNVFQDDKNTTSNTLGQLTLFTLGDETHTVNEFALHVEKIIKPHTGSSEEYLKNAYNAWSDNLIIQYQDQHLEEKSEEFRNIYQEYREGILMFNRMQEKVWDKANNDSAGLAQYFEQHKEEYRWNDRFDCEIYFCANADIMNKVAKKVKKKIAADSLLREFNKTNSLNLDYRKGKYELNDSSLFITSEWLKTLFSSDKYRKKGKIYKFENNNQYYVTVKVNQFLPAMTKSLDETRGPVASKYQDYLEANWIAELKNRYKVEVNQAAISDMKSRLVNAK